MPSKLVLISFGAPRSGTTLMERMFSRCTEDICYAKLAEGCALHPMQSDHGLVDLSLLYRHMPIIFVRTVRHPVDIMASWPFLDREILRPGKFDQALAWLRAESENYWTQDHRIVQERAKRKSKGYNPVHNLSVYFDLFGDPTACSQFFAYLTQIVPRAEENVRAWQTYLAETWDKKPVRPGRRNEGKPEDPVLSEEQVDRILAALGDVISRERIAKVSPYLEKWRIE